MVKGVMVSGVIMSTRSRGQSGAAGCVLRRPPERESGAVVSWAMVSGVLNHWAESVAGNEDVRVGNWALGLVVKLRCYRIGQW